MSIALAKQILWTLLIVMMAIIFTVITLLDSLLTDGLHTSLVLMMVMYYLLSGIALFIVKAMNTALARQILWTLLIVVLAISFTVITPLAGLLTYGLGTSLVLMMVMYYLLSGIALFIVRIG